MRTRWHALSAHMATHYVGYAHVGPKPANKRSAVGELPCEVKINGRPRDERDGGRCGLDGWVRLSATWAMAWPLE